MVAPGIMYRTPFDGGPHLRSGNKVTLIAAQTILAMVAQRYHCHAAPGHRVEPEFRVTLRPRRVDGAECRLKQQLTARRSTSSEGSVVVIIQPATNALDDCAGG